MRFTFEGSVRQGIFRVIANVEIQGSPYQVYIVGCQLGEENLGLIVGDENQGVSCFFLISSSANNIQGLLQTVRFGVRLMNKFNLYRISLLWNL